MAATSFRNLLSVSTKPSPLWGWEKEGRRELGPRYQPQPHPLLAPNQDGMDRQAYLLGVNQLPCYHHFKESSSLGSPLATLGRETDAEGAEISSRGYPPFPREQKMGVEGGADPHQPTAIQG